MREWPTVEIRDVAEVFDGPHATPKTVDVGPIFLGIGALQDGRINLGETRHVTAEDFRKWTRRVRPLPGDVVFSYETRIGQAAIIPEGLECCLGRRMGLVRPDQTRLNPRFFLYLYISPAYQTFLRSRTIHGATVDRIALREFPSFPIVLPDLGEQDAIASVLGALDDKIDLNRRMNETLEEMARAIFKDWFIDFGPTRAKMEGRMPYLAPEFWGLFPATVDVEGRPQGWADGTLGDVAEVVMGASPDGATYNDQGLGTALVNGPVEFGDFFLRQIKWTTAPTKLSQRGDLILCVRGSTTGKYAFADAEYCLGRGVAAIRGRDGLQEFADQVVKSYLRRLLEKTTGSVFPNLSSGDIRGLKVLKPSIEARERFCQLVRPFQAQIWSHVEQSSILATTRDLLLPQLMSGEIRVKDAETMVEKVA